MIKIVQEMDEVFKSLEEAGMKPLLCDTPVPCYDATVQAGIPTDPGDISPAGFTYLPSKLVASSMLMLKVRGESMRDAGFNSGDSIMVDFDARIMDGDIVVAVIDGESTLKSLMTDKEGNKWLVPHNPDFEPIRLTEDMALGIMGKVVQLIKTNPRMGYHEVQRIVDRARMKMREEQVPAREQVAEAIRSVAPYVTNSRLWFAVYRVLVDRRVLRENMFDTFVRWLEEDVPAHEHLPKAIDLQRLAVLSFSKPVRHWDVDNAPVSGKRFRDYCDIARRMEEEF